MIVEPVTVRDVKAVPPPTAAEKVTVPFVPLVKVRVCAPFKVFEKEIVDPAADPPALVASITIPAVRATGPVKVIGAPLVVTLPFKLIAEEPA